MSTENIGAEDAKQDAKQKEALLVRIAAGETLSKACGVDQNFLTLCYAVGSNAYKEKDYTTAYRAFLFLCMHEHSEADYWTALASVFVAQKQTQRALPLLQTAWRLLPSAANAYRFAECCVRCGDKEAARKVLGAALEDIERSKATSPLHARLKAMLQEVGSEEVGSEAAGSESKPASRKEERQ